MDSDKPALWGDYEDDDFHSDEPYERDEESFDEDEPWYFRILSYFWWPAALAFVLVLVALIYVPKPINDYVGGALFLYSQAGRVPSRQSGACFQARIILLDASEPWKCPIARITTQPSD